MNSQSNPEFKADSSTKKSPSEADSSQSNPASDNSDPSNQKAKTEKDQNFKPKADENKKIIQWSNEVHSMARVVDKLNSESEKLNTGFFHYSEWNNLVEKFKTLLRSFNTQKKNFTNNTNEPYIPNETKFNELNEIFTSILEKANEVVKYDMNKEKSKIQSILYEHSQNIQTKYSNLNNDYINKEFEANTIQSFIEELKEEKKDTQTTKNQLEQYKGKLAILKAQKKALQSFQSTTSSTAGTLSALLSLLPEMVDNNLRIMQAENKSLSVDLVRPHLQSFLNKKTQEMCSMLSGLKQGKPTPYVGDIENANPVNDNNLSSNHSLSKVS